MSAAEQQAVSGLGIRELWSVTNILDKSLGAPEGIVYWNCEQTAIAAIDKRETLEMRIQSDGRAETIKWLIGQRWSATERAKQRGTEVHRVAESIALGMPRPLIEPDVAAEIEPYVAQLVRWMETYKPEFVMSEAPIYNLTHGYAGTLDGIFDLPGRGRFIFDYKTTDKGPDARSRPPYSNASLQLSAYAHAEQVGLLADRRYTEKNERYYVYDPSAETQPMPTVTAALVVVISPVDCFAVPVAIGEIPYQSFLHARALADWNRDLYKQAFGVQWTAAPAT